MPETPAGDIALPATFVPHFLTLEKTLSQFMGTRNASALAEFIIFGIKQAAACVFAGSFLFLLAISSHVAIPGLARYDFLFLGALAIQAVLIATRLESPREVAVLSFFHAIGMGLELFKTSPQVHSWSYPEASFFHIYTVPLYSGFMYAAVASYMMQAWRLQDLKVRHFPPLWLASAICVAIYANFFTNHYMQDMRWPLSAIVLVVFWKTKIDFTVTRKVRHMPMVLAFFLIGFFIWVAENIATYFGGWVYPDQAQEWAIVGPNKITSWMLLVIISFIIVAGLKQAFPTRQVH